MDEKQILQELVNSSSSLTEILRKQKKSTSGTAIKILREKLDTYGITYNFIQQNNSQRRLTLDEILIENRPYKSQSLKKRLIEEGIKEDKCERCGISEWQGEKLTLQLHHINGNHNDNRLENLQILCPNCHSLTDNFVNKRKDVKVCPDCGCEINKRSEYCRKCAPKHKDVSNLSPTKDELKDLLKTLNFVEIAQKYGVTDSAIRKRCKKYGLPSNKTELKEYLQNL